MAYPHNNIPGNNGHDAKTNSARACQSQCQANAHRNCQYWTWTRSTRECWMKFGRTRLKHPGKVSGPRYC